MEQWDIYDSERRLTGRTMKKNDWILQDGEYHLTVQAGESSREAVNREVWEETGLDVSACAGGPALTYHRENPGEGDNYFVDCYLFTLPFAPEQVKIRPDEALEYKLATLEEIQELAQQGIFLHYDSIKDVFAK